MMNKADRFNLTQDFIRGASPAEWMSSAYELKESAEILWRQEDKMLNVSLEGTVGGGEKVMKKPSISRTYILLTGLAIENLLKGLLIARDPSHINTGELSNKIKSHGLLDLAEMIDGFDLLHEDVEMCKIAQDAIPYWGRYPIPRIYSGMKLERVADAQYRIVFLKLYQRLHRLIYEEVRDGWDSQAGVKYTSYRSSEYESDMLPM